MTNNAITKGEVAKIKREIEKAQLLNSYRRLLEQATKTWGGEVSRFGVGGATEQILWHDVVKLRKRLLEEMEVEW